MDNDQLKVTLKMLDIDFSSIREKDNLMCLYIPYIETDMLDYLKNLLSNNNFNYNQFHFYESIDNLYIYLKGEK